MSAVSAPFSTWAFRNRHVRRAGREIYTALRQNPPRHETDEASQNVLINEAHQRTPVLINDTPE